LTSCGGGGGGDPKAANDEGYSALNSGNHQDALSRFQSALEGLDASDPQYMRAKMGEIEALTHLDADGAKDALLGLGDQAGEGEYSKVANTLTGQGNFIQAIDVLDAGVKRYGESPKLKAMLELVRAEAEKSGSSDALDKLKGLGYL
jgi:tetratricopeptide (TPR) repeat protein